MLRVGEMLRHSVFLHRPRSILPLPGPPRFPKFPPKPQNKAGEHVFIRLVTSAPRHPFICVGTIHDLSRLIYQACATLVRSTYLGMKKGDRKRSRQWASNTGATVRAKVRQITRTSVRVWLHNP
ncbi:hypothetical protein NEUTE1DRAFT_117616 [Neurospora tetrasperma FGSC 2508]|uniref:Uncharacterized protein n=1 Tax=Neurospora tetrasperma (strain FGSC 2508 / ATCC MYA-4615 / P0657) TaxID=510951 RepID=F8MRR3_NEUT8|nr:uncharacterized protein NEUTE1DRAFT_117616 [Neurospora tetrasperma FGSC 2508]EGO54960.1 hypothetical protein NEUTE1DRAFT_117616 [Neurospora tetrasperma FGSC 2508]EGZ69849.1 hypothetical protein NEUTE2DRAFT_145675 [Neurospora tetrasperma FGSC 2509]